MALDEKLLQDVQELPEVKKHPKDIEAMMDAIIDTNKDALLEMAK